MTTDILQNKYAQKPLPALNIGAKPIELTRDQSFLDGQHDIFDLLSQENIQARDIVQNPKETYSLLKRAQIAMKRAEQTIRIQKDQLQNSDKDTTTDVLTGLSNHKGFIEALQRDVSRTNRGLSSGGLLIMFNLENYNTILNQHGEKAIDKTLKLLAKAFENEIRDMDLVGRIDQDEFALLFTDTTMEQALNRLQNMAIRLNRLSLIWDNSEIRINLSLGLKSYQHGDKAANIFDDVVQDLQRNRLPTP